MCKRILPLIVLIIMLLNSTIVFDGALSGLLLWFNTVLPTLFPFMIITYYIQNVYEDNITHPTFYCIILGLTCGTPIGALIITSIYSLNKINKRTAYILLCSCNISSPAFIISYIIIKCLNSYNSLIILYSIYFPSALILFIYLILFSKSNVTQNTYQIKEDIKKEYSYNNLDYIVTKSCSNILKIGAYIIISSILAEFIKNYSKCNYLIKGTIIGLMEITSGINYIVKNTYDISKSNIMIPLIIFINALGGLSFAMQANTFIKNTDLSIIKYVMYKFLYAMLSLLIYIALNIIIKL